MKKLIISLLILTTMGFLSSDAMFRARFTSANNALKAVSSLKWEVKPTFEQRVAEVKNQYPMPKLPTHRIQNRDLWTHESLCERIVNQTDVARQDKRDLNWARIWAPPFALLGNELTGFLGLTYFLSARDCYRNSNNKLKKLEQEIKDLVKEQNRELRLADDIQ